jgi:hypothetical protein
MIDTIRNSTWRYELGQTVVVLGLAEGGPVMQPIEPRSRSEAIDIFSGGALVEALVSGMTEAPESHWVGIRINGQPARVVLPVLPGEEISLLAFETVSGTDLWNETEIIISEVDDVWGIQIPASPIPITYNLPDYITVGALITAINLDAADGTSPIYAVSSDSDRLTEDIEGLVGAYALEGGLQDADIEPNEAIAALGKSLQLIEGRDFDVLIIAGLYADDPYEDSAYTQESAALELYGTPPEPSTLIDPVDPTLPGSAVRLVVEFCDRQAQGQQVVAAFLGTRPLENPDLLLEYQDDYADLLIEHLTDNNRALFRSRFGNDAGRFLHIVCGELAVNEIAHPIHVSAAVQYLRAIFSSSTTNSPLPGRLNWELDGPTRIRLAELGIQTAYTDPDDQVRLWSGVTCAMPSSDFRHSANLRQIQVTSAAVLSAIDVYVGENYGTLYRTSQLDHDLTNLLDGFVSSRIVSDYTLFLEYIPVENLINVAFSLTPKIGTESMTIQGKVNVA